MYRSHHAPIMMTLLGMALPLVLALALQVRTLAGEPAGRAEVVRGIPGLVGYWAFSEPAGQPRMSADTVESHALEEVGGPIARVEGGPFSGYSAELNGKQFFRIPYDKTGDLNICGPKAQVSMFAVVRLENLRQSRTIAGMWSEGRGAHDDSGTRQYALLLNMPTYGGPRQLTPHISSEGGVTRRADGSGLPWCADYAATKSEVTENEWCTLGFTYDGEFIRAYINGVMEERPLDPVPDKRTDRYFTQEGPGGGDRGMNPYYHGRGIFCYDPAQHAESKPGGGSDFTVGARYAVGSMLGEASIGRFGGLAVFKRALTDVEMQSLHASAGVEKLNRGLPFIGRIVPRSASKIPGSTWSIGGETLDRDFAVYANYKKFLGPLGAKAIRLQAGWAKCEIKPGVYDWAWLDEVVDDALAQGVQPWIETSYGNPLYPGGGDTGLGGGFPNSPEALAAWDNWVRALVQRYRDRVREWEIWNEPDLSATNTPEEYASLFVRTATIIREEQPGSQIYALALCHNVGFGVKFLERLQQRGELSLVNAVTVHGYPHNPDNTYLADGVWEWLRLHAPDIGVRQGETGAPSTSATFGALSGMAWTELTQAKWNLRRMLAHHGKGYPFSLFTLMELHYPGRVNTKGLLKSNPDMTVAYPKPAYVAAQNVFAVFDDTVRSEPKPAFTASVTNRIALDTYRQGAKGRPIVAIWFNADPPKEANTPTPVDLKLRGLKFAEPVYADLLSGHVFEIPPDCWSADGDTVSFQQIPIYDSPILVAEREALLLVPISIRPDQKENQP